MKTVIETSTGVIEIETVAEEREVQVWRNEFMLGRINCDTEVTEDRLMRHGSLKFGWTEQEAKSIHDDLIARQQALREQVGARNAALTESLDSKFTAQHKQALDILVSTSTDPDDGGLWAAFIALKMGISRQEAGHLIADLEGDGGGSGGALVESFDYLKVNSFELTQSGEVFLNRE